MELRQLRYFLAVCHARNFTRAAYDLHVTQPSLSRQIQLLEAEVGVLLFHRVRHGVELTEAGEVFADHCRLIIDEVERARVALNDLQGLQRGHVRLASVATVGHYLLPPAIARFSAERPGIRVSVQTLKAMEVEAAVAGGEADLGFTYLPLSSKQVQAEPILAEVLVLTCPSRRPLPTTECTWAAIRDIPLILPPPGYCLRRIIDAHFDRAGVFPAVQMEVSDLHALLDLGRNRRRV